MSTLNTSCSFCFGYKFSALFIWKYMLRFLSICLCLSPVSQTLSIWVTASAGSTPAIENCFLSFLSTADRLSVTYWEYKGLRQKCDICVSVLVDVAVVVKIRRSRHVFVLSTDSLPLHLLMMESFAFCYTVTFSFHGTPRSCFAWAS